MLTLVACAPAAGPGDRPDTSAPLSTAGRASHDLPGADPARAPDEEEAGQVLITVGDQRFTARLADSAATRDLLDQLPVTVPMTDHGGVEKTGRLPLLLDVAGQPDAADPGVGDLGYYAPGQDLVLYYGDQSSYAGIVVLGQLTGDAAERLRALDGSITATVDAVD